VVLVLELVPVPVLAVLVLVPVLEPELGLVQHRQQIPAMPPA